MPHLFLDATYLKRGRDGRARSTAVATAIGVGSDGVRRMLGIAAIDTEARGERGVAQEGLDGRRDRDGTR